MGEDRGKPAALASAAGAILRQRSKPGGGLPRIQGACDTNRYPNWGGMMSGILPRRAWLAGGAALAALPAVAWAQASAWPSQPIRLVVPFAPGGTTDLVARLLTQGLAARLGQPVIIENRPGAGATVGSAQVAQAAPDGLTLLMSNIASHGVAPSLYRNLRYDALRDFTHIALVVENPSVFVANPRFAPQTLPEVVRLSHELPRGLDMASSGSGSSNHLLIVQFGQVTGARVNHVPYRGAGPAMTDVIANVVPMMSDSLPSAAGHIRLGSVRGLAMASATRHPAFPDGGDLPRAGGRPRQQFRGSASPAPPGCRPRWWSG